MLTLLPGIVPNVASGIAPDVDCIRKALQWGVTLENSVIPPYLYALYSLKGTNDEIANVLREIVNEEMLHLALACNLLNAIGGHPQVDDPALVTTYPRLLPGTAPNTPKVELAPFSLSTLEAIFKPIEAPEDPVDFVCPHCPSQPKPNPSPVRPTVGDLYRAIGALLHEASEDIFKLGNPGCQIVSGIHGLVEVVDLKSADKAIRIIIDQGEGGAGSPVTEDGELSHYYKLDGISKGYELIPNPKAPPGAPMEQRYIFDGPPIQFDPADVWPVPTNPKMTQYAEGSAARHVVNGFNYTYTSLLKCLHRMANGRPGDFAGAFGLMFSLQQQAVGMMSGDTPPGDDSIGPSFEYLATNEWTEPTP